MNYNNPKWNKLIYRLWKFLHHRRQHDPLLAFNMSIFNIEDGWSRIFNRIKVRENG